MKTYNISLLLTPLILSSLTACQGPTQQDWQAFCENDKWAQHGYFDATEGFPIKIVKAYQDSCGAQFTQEDLDRYQVGFIKGIKEFCTEENGYELGSANKPNPDTCPPEMRRPFLAGYQRGRGDYIQTRLLMSREKQKYEAFEDGNRPPRMQPEVGE